ncbi:Methyltransferase-like protein 11A [Operophtera brumata]|uniref:Alpha N-terminal protein methyltransferase 1 n=1 Tax=Operophtera brumata TaxID=104452 RepID=A0A0L7LVN7_OPEBR|nr:Methyltransferase-like protein 11A [Operophtera brumata]
MVDNKFYKKAAGYWANVPATVDGVLGGYGHISDIDINASKAFLEKVFAFNNPPEAKLAIDCGAGIGRISKYLLIPQFDKVDLVEQDEKFISSAKQFIGEDNDKLGTLYQIGLQDFVFEPHKKYDVIWCQWVLGHLNDYHLIYFLRRCISALAKNGVIVIKENVTTTEEMEYDEDDSSVTRPVSRMKMIFSESNLKILHTEIQNDFPEDIYPVHSFALTPVT